MEAITLRTKVAVLAAVLLAGAVLVGQEETNGLHLAALRGDVEAVRRHIEAGSNLDEKDAYGSTPLIIAATFGRTEVAEVLIRAGAGLNIGDREGSAPLHIAALLGRAEIVRALVDHGADVRLRNGSGSSPFDIAASPLDDDMWIYDRLRAALGPLGLELDDERIKAARPVIAEMLRARPEDLTNVGFAPRPGGGWKVSTPAAQGLDPRLVAELYLDAAEMETLYGLLLVKNGYLIAEGYFNGAAAGQKNLLASVTKSFTSALVGIALDQGHLKSLDQKMLEFFPELGGRIDDPRKFEITVRHLLQMRAGFPWEELTPEHFRVLYAGFRPRHLADFPLAGDPGAAFRYSNLSSHLLGVIVARATGTDLKAYAEKRLFSPLNADAGDWTKDLDGNTNGHADLRLTARDAAKFGQLYLDGGLYEGKRVVPAAWVKESLRNLSEDAWISKDRLDHAGRHFRDLGYGYQWWSARVGARRFAFAWGHGGQLIVLLDDLDMVIVVTADAYWRRHDDESWRNERANINLVGKFIRSLPEGR